MLHHAATTKITTTTPGVEKVSTLPRRKELLCWFGLIVTFQWTIFCIMIIVEVTTTPTSSSSSYGDVRKNWRKLMMVPDVDEGDTNFGVKMSETPVKSSSSSSSSSNTCFSSSCLEQTARSISRVYPNRTDHNFCIASGRNKNHQDRWQGLILVKGKTRAQKSRFEEEEEDHEGEEEEEGTILSHVLLLISLCFVSFFWYSRACLYFVRPFVFFLNYTTFTSPQGSKLDGG